ncbi:hypothetical protein [Actinoplanes sp. NPDC051851]|uniref:hypothetical protein n=1 Tax=Actinoplanes sp. NPDC051851 TaxID=3154753 RepID=UPI00342391B6
MPHPKYAGRPHLRVAGVAALVFIGAGSLLLSRTVEGTAGTVVYSLLPIAWLTICVSLASLSLAAARR